MWKELIQNLDAGCEFRPAALETEISDAERALSLQFPNSLKGLLLETNGIYSSSAFLMLVWPLNEILRRNLEMRNNSQFAEIYMSFQSLLFFADAGVDGIKFAYPISASRNVQDRNIIAWYPMEDSRPVIALSLEDYLKRSLSSGLKL